MPLPDQRTLFLVLLLCTFLQAVVLFLVSRVHRQYPGPRLWGPAAMVVFVGNSLFLLRGSIPDILSVVAANTMIWAGFALISHGLHLFIGRPSPRRFFWALCLAGAALLAVFNYLLPSLAIRVVVYCLALGSLMLEMAWALHHAVWGKHHRVFRFTSVTFLAFALYMLFRAGFTVHTGQAPPLLEPNLMFSVNLLVHIFITLTLMVGLPMMMSARLEADLEAHVADLRDEIRMRKEAEQRLAREAALDPLTGLYNRRKFFSDAAKAASLARRHGLPLSLIIFDLDHFKEINDTHGHEAGDQVLIALAGLCQGRVRAEDTLARVGGEEFVVLLPDTDQENAMILAERLRLGIANLAVGPPAGRIRLTASFGVSQFRPAEESGVEGMLKRADQALYAAKQAGRDQVRAFQDGPAQG